MSDCIDKRFEKMLSAYELGILKGNEELEFELHLYECEYCYNQIRKFEQASQYIRNNPRIRTAINSLSKNRAEGEQAVSILRRFLNRAKSRRVSFIPAVAVGLALLIILILKPWTIQVQPDLAAYADNRLTILYFEDLTGLENTQKLERITTNLLITDLAESQFINVLSSQRLNDIINLLTYEDPSLAGKDITFKIAEKAKAKWILKGSILQTEPNIELTSQLVSVADGSVFATQKISGGPGDDIFSMVDKLTKEIKKDLALPHGASEEPDKFISDITTSSEIAYRYYVDGLNYYQKLYLPEAAESFEKAVAHDSTFAMAYYYLALTKDRNFIHKAVEFVDKAGRIDKYYIRYSEAFRSGDIVLAKEYLEELLEYYPDEKYAYLQLGTIEFDYGYYDKAIEANEKVIKLDPLNRLGYNQLAYAYHRNGDFENALRTIDKYIEIAPDEANPFDTKAELYASNGMLDSAIEAYQTAIQIKPDFYNSHNMLGLIYIYKGEYNRAESLFNLVLREDQSTIYHSSAVLYKTCIPIIRGEFGRAHQSLDIIIDTCKERCYIYHFLKAQIYWQSSDWAAAIDQIEKTVETWQAQYPHAPANYRQMFTQILAESGNITMAKKKAEEIKNLVNPNRMSQYYYALAVIDMAEGEYDQAKSHLECIKKYDSRFFIRFMYARTLLLSGKTDRAVAELEEITREYTPSRLIFGIWSAKAYYLLGLALEEVGRPGEAAESYSTFLDIWKDADGGIREIDDARERLARLKNL